MSRHRVNCVIDRILEEIWDKYKYTPLSIDDFNVEPRFLAESILEEEFGWKRSKLVKVQFEIDDDGKLMIVFYDNRYNKRLNDIDELIEILYGGYLL